MNTSIKLNDKISIYRKQEVKFSLDTRKQVNVRTNLKTSSPQKTQVSQSKVCSRVLYKLQNTYSIFLSKPTESAVVLLPCLTHAHPKTAFTIIQCFHRKESSYKCTGQMQKIHLFHTSSWMQQVWILKNICVRVKYYVYILYISWCFPGCTLWLVRMGGINGYYKI